MKINLIAVGQQMPAWVESGFAEYTKRIYKPFQLQLHEIPLRQRSAKADITRLMEEEGRQMLTKAEPQDLTIAMHAAGQLWSSEQLAAKLNDWQCNYSRLNLLIGGPEGLAPECLASAKLQWSLSPLTFPHPLVRIIIAEQLYRAICILNKHPYHK